MTRCLVPVAIAALVVLGGQPASPIGQPGFAQAGVKKHCRIVEMCWIKNGKKHCFKKLVCE